MKILNSFEMAKEVLVRRTSTEFYDNSLEPEVKQEVMAKAEYYMGLLVANVVNVLDPEAVVLGGGVVERLGEAYLEPVRETAEQHYLNQQDKDRVHIVETKLRGYAGVLGAAMLANQSWKRDRKKK